MNILWIEDFGGGLSSGTETLESMFKGLNVDGTLDFLMNWNEDEPDSLIKNPVSLEKFCKDQKSKHCIYLCRNYFDYLEFKANHAILNEIDAVITDINLENRTHVSLDLAIPEAYADNKTKFHANAGFFIFNDLIHLGIPEERMCFITGEKNSFKGFEEKCSEIYMPKVTAFEKTDADYEKVREWIKKQESDYVKLRRGIIAGCAFLKSHIEKDEANIQFRDFIKIENKQPAIEIPSTDIKNYLDALSQFLGIKQPDDPNIHYRLFLRTLVHEWEENVDANSLKERHGNDLSKIRDIYTFAWLMKMTRNWVSHANLLEPLNPQIIAFLFLVNMRAMFKLSKAIQPYEHILLHCIYSSPNAIDFQTLNTDISYVEQNVDGILAGLNINESGNFGNKINAIYRKNTGNPDAEEHDFKVFLLQYFWVNQKPDLRNLTAASDDFLPTLARHIYSHSFS